MELYQMRYFIAVAEEENVSAAARRLNVSQPPLTRSIQALEREVGHPLLVRSNKGVSLTPSGQQFLVEARETLVQAERTINRSRAAGRGELGQVRVGYFGTNIFHYLPGVINGFREVSPDVQILLRTMNKFDQTDALRRNKLDIGIARFYQKEPDLIAENVAHEGLVAALPQRFSTSRSDGVTCDELCSYPIILSKSGGGPSYADEIVRILGSAGFAPTVSNTTDNIVSLMGLVASGVGVSIVPSSIALLKWPFVRSSKITDLDQTVPITLLYSKYTTNSATLEFVKYCRSYDFNDLSDVSTLRTDMRV